MVPLASPSGEQAIYSHRAVSMSSVSPRAFCHMPSNRLSGISGRSLSAGRRVKPLPLRASRYEPSP